MNYSRLSRQLPLSKAHHCTGSNSILRPSFVPCYFGGGDGLRPLLSPISPSSCVSTAFSTPLRLARRDYTKDSNEDSTKNANEDFNKESITQNFSAESASTSSTSSTTQSSTQHEESRHQANQEQQKAEGNQDTDSKQTKKDSGYSQFEKIFLLGGGLLALGILASVFFPPQREAVASNPSTRKVPQVSEERLAQLQILARQDLSHPGTLEALAELGYIYSQLGQNEKAEHFLRKAASNGDTTSSYNLALLLLLESKLDRTSIFASANPYAGVKKAKVEEAVELLKKVAREGHAKAMMELGRLHLLEAKTSSHSASKKNLLVQEAVSLLEQSARKGVADANMVLGGLYFFGIPEIVEVDPKKAIDNYRVAAHSGTDGSAEAMFHYGMALKNGFGVPKDVEKGLEYIQKSADQDYHMAIYEIGTLLLKGIPGKVVANPIAAFRCFEKASNLGNRDAAYMVAHCYIQGLGVERDVTKSFKILELLAPNDAHAKVSLGVCYAQGNGVEKDYRKAVEIWGEVLNDDTSLSKNPLVQFAAFSEASFNLGVCYLHGMGVGKDVSIAKEFFTQAASYGHPQAKDYLQEIERKG